MRQRPVVLATLLIAALTGALAAAAGRPSFPPPPAPGRVISDGARLITSEDSAEISRLAGALLADKRLPMSVVTIRSLAAQGAEGYTIGRYAAELLQTWRDDETLRTYGMVLVVAAEDRVARIQLGSAWGHAHDDRARTVMNQLILPSFRHGQLSKGILNGVRGFDAMGREQRLPTTLPSWMPVALPLDTLGEPWWRVPALVGLALLVIVGLIAIARGGRKSWAWAAAAFILGVIVARIFGGGSSEASESGGGATGEW